MKPKKPKKKIKKVCNRIILVETKSKEIAQYAICKGKVERRHYTGHWYVENCNACDYWSCGFA